MNIALAFTSATIFTIMLTIGVNESLQQLVSLWRQPAILIRALLAVIVLVPMLVAVLLWVFDLPPAVATGLALLAAAPGAPLTTTRAKLAEADTIYVSSLQLTVALLAVVITPLTLAIYYALFELTIEAVSPIRVASQVARVTFLPVVIGLLLQRKASQGIDSYFLGNRRLPWWVLGASGMASNTDVAGTMINTAFGDRRATCSVTDLTISKFFCKRSSRLIPGLRGRPEVMTTTSEPSVAW